MKIGRCTDIKLEAFSPSDSTVGITVTSKVDAFTSRVVLQQLQGMSGATVPVIGDDCDPIVKGFYRVLSVSGNVAPADWQRRNEVRVALALEPVAAGGASATVETYLTGIERPTDHSPIDTGNLQATWPCPPPTWRNRPVVQRDGYGAVGTFGYQYLNSLAGFTPDYVLRTGAVADSYYDGAATLEAWYEGASRWVVVEGRDLLPVAAIRLSNGVFRATLSATAIRVQRVIDPGADATVWGEWFDFTVVEDSSATAFDLQSEYATVARNDWTSVVVKVPAHGVAGTDGILSLRLDAFQEVAEVSFDQMSGLSGAITSPTLQSSGTGVQTDAAFGETTNLATSDVNNHRWIVVSPNAGTVTSSHEFDSRGVGLGVAQQEDDDNLLRIVKCYFYAQSPQQSVVTL